MFVFSVVPSESAPVIWQFEMPASMSIALIHLLLMRVATQGDLINSILINDLAGQPLKSRTFLTFWDGNPAQGFLLHISYYIGGSSQSEHGSSQLVSMRMPMIYIWTFIPDCVPAP